MKDKPLIDEDTLRRVLQNDANAIGVLASFCWEELEQLIGGSQFFEASIPSLAYRLPPLSQVYAEVLIHILSFVRRTSHLPPDDVRLAIAAMTLYRSRTVSEPRNTGFGRDGFTRVTRLSGSLFHRVSHHIDGILFDWSDASSREKALLTAKDLLDALASLDPKNFPLVPRMIALFEAWILGTVSSILVTSTSNMEATLESLQRMERKLGAI